ncbi:MAG: toll/interleukin-1 receptor domain-containing protein [Acidimicrobiia bacterium]|nr:toll/interleukin-1 receptor domain-containing protein [Acidimicrobiia bacterium]
MPELATTYDGFISYSHAADDLLAPRLQAGLQRFAKPWWKRRAVRIFRDESSLSANPHLWSSITEALDTSGWFVLLLSPDAAQSEWVNQEIAYWVEHRDPKKVLPVVTDGTFDWQSGDVTGDAVPDALRGVFTEEPRWVDVRWAKDEDQLDLQDPRFADAVADIASTIRGIPKDDLASEEVRQHRRTVRTAWAAGILLVVLGIAAGVTAVQATRSANEAQGRALLAAARNASQSDMDLALLLTLQAAELLGSGDGSVEGELHNILMVGTDVRPLDVSDEAHAKSFAVAERPGTTQIAASAAGNQVGLFEQGTGELISSFGAPNDNFSPSIPSIAFDRPGDRLAAISTSGVLTVWDVETGAILVEIDTGEGATGRVLFGPEDDTLITSIHARTVWDIESRSPLWRNSDRVDSIGGVDISYDPGGRWLAWSNREVGQVTVADLATGEEVWTIPLPGAVAVDFHPRLDVLAVKSQNIGTQMYDVSTDNPEMLLAIEGAAPTAIAFDADGGRFAVGGDNGVEVYASSDPLDPAASWVQIAYLPTGASFGFDYEFLSDGSSLAIGHKQGAGVFSLDITGEVTILEFGAPAWTIEGVPGTSLVYSAHPPIVGGNALLLHDLDRGTTTVVSDGDLSASGWAVARSVSAGAVAAYLPGEDMVAILDPSSGSVIKELDHPGGRAPWAIDVAQDGSTVVAGLARSSEIVVWDATSGEITQRVSVDGIGDVRSLRLSPTASIVAVGGDGGLVLVDLEAATEPERLPAEGSILGVGFSPDGSTLAAADDTFGFLYVYSVADRTRERTITMPGAFDPEFTPDGSQLIMAGAQSGVIAFDTRTWERRWTIPRENLPGVILTLDVVGDRAVFSPIFGPLIEISLDFDELLGIARDRLNRGFEEAECVQYRIDPCPTLEEIRSR